MKPMPAVLHLCWIMILACSLTSCEKKAEEVQRNIIVDLITNGSWIISSFTESNVDMTGTYTGYEFKFYENRKVEAYLGGVVATGTFDADAVNYRITSAFPAGSPAILMKLNETWSITKTTLTSVEAKPLNAGRVAFLKLVKKQ